jgi:hypothetical protein
VVHPDVDDPLPQQNRYFPGEITLLESCSLFSRLQRHYQPLIKRFNGFIGDEKSYLEASRYFQKKFIRLNKSSEKEVYAHFTNATGTESETFLRPILTLFANFRYQHSSKRHELGSGHYHEQQFSTSHIVILHYQRFNEAFSFVSIFPFLWRGLLSYLSSGFS